MKNQTLKRHSQEHHMENTNVSKLTQEESIHTEQDFTSTHQLAFNFQIVDAFVLIIRMNYVSNMIWLQLNIHQHQDIQEDINNMRNISLNTNIQDWIFQHHTKTLKDFVKTIRTSYRKDQALCFCLVGFLNLFSLIFLIPLKPRIVFPWSIVQCDERRR